MRALSRIDMFRESLPDSKTGDLNTQLRLALGINTCARLLLHDTTTDDPTTSVLAFLAEATGMSRVTLFRKQTAEDDDIAFEWLGPTTDTPLEGYRWSAETVASLADGKPVPIKREDGFAGDPSNDEIPRALSGLVIPIQVFGKWWGGVLLASDEDRCSGNESILQFLGTVADLFGVFFERQIASREDAQSDKLAGALEMAGTVCHKLNQPMQVILGYASMVTSGDISEPDQICEIIKMIEDETRRMGIITKNLMGITKYRSVETPEVGAMCDIDNPAALS